MNIIDTSIQDWASNFISNSNELDQVVLPASVSPEDLAKYVSAIANADGGHILIGAISEKGYGSCFQNVSSELIENFQRIIEGVDWRCCTNPV